MSNSIVHTRTRLRRYYQSQGLCHCGRDIDVDGRWCSLCRAANELRNRRRLASRDPSPINLALRDAAIAIHADVKAEFDAKGDGRRKSTGPPKKGTATLASHGSDDPPGQYESPVAMRKPVKGSALDVLGAQIYSPDQRRAREALYAAVGELAKRGEAVETPELRRSIAAVCAAAIALRKLDG